MTEKLNFNFACGFDSFISNPFFGLNGYSGQAYGHAVLRKERATSDVRLVINPEVKFNSLQFRELKRTIPSRIEHHSVVKSGLLKFDF